MSIKENIKSFLLSNIVVSEERKLGIEEELIIYKNNGSRLPVNKSNEFSAVDLLEIINRKTSKNGYYTLEPGGQLEWSSPPLKNLNKLNDAIKKHKDILSNLLKEYDLRSISYATDPQFSPEDIELIQDKKYQLMDERFETSGTMGRWMMRNSASIQINFDATGKKELEEMAFIADSLHPVSSFVFSNSPFINNSGVGIKNMRNSIWENTDKKRCRNLFDHNIYSSSNLLEKYIEYVLKVPAIFKIDKHNNLKKSDKTINLELEFLKEQNRLTPQNIKFYLQQIFTNVRLKNVLEVRGADRTPFGFELAPVAFWTGLLTDEKTKESVLSEINKWTFEDRKIFNIASLQLDDSQQGPMGNSYNYWNKWAIDLAIKGLKNRGKGEETYLEKFTNRIKDKGPFTLQLQNNES